MSLHAYSRCWLHLTWGTHRRERLLHKKAAADVSRFLSGYAKEKKLQMKANHVNADHVHALIDLPTDLTIEETVQLLKGSSSHWINSNNLVDGNFAWARADTQHSQSQNPT